MSLKIGIVGLPNVGKSTLFKALTKQSVEIANYPFATIDPNVGVVEVPDERLQKLSEMSHSKKTVPAVVEFVDIAGLVKGAAEGAGLGNKFLTNIKEVDAIAEVVRVFEDKNIIHVAETPDPLSDIEVIEYELILKDLEVVVKRLDTAERDLRGNKKGVDTDAAVLKKIKEALEKGLLSSFAVQKLDSAELETFSTVNVEIQLLTAKPIIYVFNASEKQVQEHWQPSEEIHPHTNRAQENGAEHSARSGVGVKKRIGNAPYVVISAKIEAELADLPEQEHKEFLVELKLKESGLDQLIRTGYEALGLMTFFTTGEDESRAWTIPIGSSAPRAGRAIHSDFEQKFIRAEVINWQKLLEAGSWAKARELGTLRTEGKDYIVQDGDVIEFKV